MSKNDIESNLLSWIKGMEGFHPMGISTVSGQTMVVGLYGKEQFDFDVLLYAKYDEDLDTTDLYLKLRVYDARLTTIEQMVTHETTREAQNILHGMAAALNYLPLQRG